MPVRIHRLNQTNLLTPAPCFDFLFARNCRVRIDKLLVVNQSSKVVTAGETGHDFVLVLKYPARQASGDARVQDMRARPVRHDVNVESLGTSHKFLFNAGVIPTLAALQIEPGIFRGSLLHNPRSLVCDG